MVDLIAVDSTMITPYGYDDETATMYVKSHSGRRRDVKRLQRENQFYFLYEVGKAPVES